MGRSNMNQQLPQFIDHVVDRLQSVEGIVAISLGGSRLRGNHTPKSWLYALPSGLSATG